MARITVEDCIDKFPSRFELVLVAANRARKLHAGENSKIDKDNDKNTVIALREIAEESLSIETLKNNLIEEYQTATLNDDEEFNESNEPIEVNEDLSDDLAIENVKVSEQLNQDQIDENNDDESAKIEDEFRTDNDDEISENLDNNISITAPEEQSEVKE